jgi:hypothetical protein
MTFEMALQEFYLLARSKGTSLREYASTALRKTAEYPLVMQSLEAGGTRFIPINDAHPGGGYRMGVVAAFSLLSSDPEWKRMYAALLQNQEAEPDYFLLSLATQVEDLPETGLQPSERFSVLPDTGQIQCRREASGIGMINFHYATGPNYVGHCHGDKGSVVLEVVDEPILIERGAGGYSNPETGTMKLSNRHSMTVPFDEDGEWYGQPVEEGYSGTLEDARLDDGKLRVRSDDTGAWPEGLYEKATREVVSNAANEYTITDYGSLATPVGGVAVLYQTLLPVEPDGEGFVIHAKRARVRITPVGWKPVTADCERVSVDGELRPVNVIRFATGPLGEYRLTTKIQVLPPLEG